MLSIGLMSGTSMDGIDAALITTDGKSLIHTLDHVSIQYDDSTKILLKAAELAARNASGNLQIAETQFTHALQIFLKNEFGLSGIDISTQIKNLSQYFHHDENKPVTLRQVITRSTELHAHAVNLLLQKTNMAVHEIDVIGYHGQTLFHSPTHKISLQVGDGNLLARLTGITTVNDFRSRDIAEGGQGAPFAPLFHQALAARDKKIPVAVVNCGGIANISIVTGNQPTDVIGFDTGPGNGLIDRCVRHFTQGVEHMDVDGKYGRQGKVSEPVLKLLYETALTGKAGNFFEQIPPKSLDIGELNFIPELKSLSLHDACRTLEAFTADTIVESLKFVKEIPAYWILAGGGWNNPVICEELATRLKRKVKATIVNANDIGWNSQALEAQLFAYLAVRSLLQLPISLPGTTRVPEPLSGGVTYYAPQGPTAIVADIHKQD
jgi:anhydro-N-acetylmuramic acid kinase